MAASTGRVLVVDDEPIVREILEGYLHRGGFDVATASDGPGALDAFEAHRPDLIVLDLMLRGSTGWRYFDGFARPDRDCSLCPLREQSAVSTAGGKVIACRGPRPSTCSRSPAPGSCCCRGLR